MDYTWRPSHSRCRVHTLHRISRIFRISRSSSNFHRGFHRGECSVTDNQKWWRAVVSCCPLVCWKSKSSRERRSSSTSCLRSCLHRGFLFYPSSIDLVSMVRCECSLSLSLLRNVLAFWCGSIALIWLWKKNLFEKKIFGTLFLFLSFYSFQGSQWHHQEKE